MFKSWISSLFRPRPSPVRRARPVTNRVSLAAEVFEDRTVPSTFTVTRSTDDSSTGSLRWAVNRANATPGADTINFDASVSSITLTRGELLLTDSAETTIVGASTGTQISGGGLSRAFEVFSTARATLDSLKLVNGYADNGGAVVNFGTLAVANSIISGNVASVYGGGIANLSGGTLTVTNSTISGNKANGSGSVGGGIASLYRTTLTVTGSTVSNNESWIGGGIDTEWGTATVTNSTITGNTASDQGAGFSNFRGTLTITNSTVSNNTAANWAGGINNHTGTLRVTNSIVSGNTANEQGGGIRNYLGPLTVTGSTISGNTGRIGGGIGSFSGVLTVANSTVAGNTGSIGGGVDIEQSTATITNSTIAGNSASVLGGGISAYESALIINNTIVAHSTGVDISVLASVATGSHNLVQDGSGGLVGTITGDPLLATLGNYGGPTQTMPLLPGSRALDAGDSSLATGAGLTTDQRGYLRIGGPAVDIGAFEVSDAPTDVVLSNNSVPENQPVGTLIGYLSSTAPTPGISFTYTLVVGTGSADNALFTISGDQLLTGAVFDFETRSSYSVRVRTTNAAGWWTEHAFTITVANVAEVTGFDVQKGLTERSFVRYLDLDFASTIDVVSTGRIQLTRYNLDGTGGTAVGLGPVSVTGARLSIDFGAQGIGGNRNTSAGDGYYVLSMDLDGNGTFETTLAFYRLFGDANGDRKVDAADGAFILGAYGQLGPSLEGDVNGDGVVNALDRTYALRVTGAALGAGLWIDD